MAMKSSSDIILTSYETGILKVTLNRPHRKNALIFESYTRIVEILSNAIEREDVDCVILTGAGDYFSSGADVKDGGFDFAQGASDFKFADSPPGQFMSALVHFPKLLVAIVNGPAVGIAAAMLAHFDLVFASDESFFWTPFFELALIPECCSSLLFPLILGPSRAGKMLYLGKHLQPNEAKECGFIADYFPQDKLSQTVESEILSLLQKPLASKSIKVFKTLMKKSRLKILDSTVHKEFDFIEERLKAGDPIKALSQRRKSKL